MSYLKWFISLFVFITVNYNHAYVECVDSDVENRQLGGVPIPNGRNISLEDDGHVVESLIKDDTPLTLSKISELFSDILDAPDIKIATRVYQLYRAKMDPIEVVSSVLSSNEIKQLIDNRLTRIDVTSDVITAVQSLVSSPEVITVIDAIMNNNHSSTSKQLCVLHNFTKVFRQLFLTSLATNTTLSHYVFSLGNFTGVEAKLNDQLLDIFKSNEAGLENFVFSPIVDTILDIHCVLASRISIRDTDNDLSDTANQRGDDIYHSQKAEAHAISDNVDLTGLSTYELLDQLQAAFNAPELAEIIGNINSTLNIDQIITQLQAAVSSGNLTELLQIFSQLQNGSLGNDIVTFQEFILDVVQQVNGSWVIIQPFVRDIIENIFRETLKENGVSNSCQDSSFDFLHAFLAGETWTLQVVDAMGELPRDLSVARTLWLGNFDECTSVSSSSIDGSEPFGGKYCRVAIPNPGLHPMYKSKLTLGTCVPRTCSATDTLGLLLTVQKLMLNGSTPIIPSINCIEDKEFGTDAVIVTCILVIIVFIVVCGTLYDVVFIQSKSSKTGSKDSTSGTCDGLSLTSSSPNHPDCLYKPMKTGLKTSPAFINTGDEELGNRPIKLTEKEINEYRTVAEESGNVALNDLDSKGDKHKYHQSYKGTLEKLLLSFSAYTNGVKLLNTEQPSGAFSAIYGIRFFSMAWIILGHTFSFARSYHDSLATHYDEKTHHWLFCLVMYSSVAVDSFFAISGILVCNLTLRQLEKVGGAKNMNWFRFYIHRFWRLTPSYMLILMTATVLVPYVATGPMWEEIPGSQGCREYWWTNLLYINNFVNIYPDTSNMCMAWTWYLANDMQFYILSPLIIVPFFYNVKAGVTSSVVFLATTITTIAVIVHKYEYQAQTTNFAYAPIPKDGYIMQRAYYPCYTRIGPYIIGLMTGYLLYRLKSTCRIPKVVNLLCWCVCLAICCVCVFGPYSYKDEHIFTQLQSDAFLALHKTGWGIAICWIVFACATGNGGWINELLSWRPFIPLGKLTYAAYLVHPVVMYTFYASRRFPANITDYALYLFVGHVVMSYGAAFVTCLMFETPMMGLEKVIFGNHRK